MAARGSEAKEAITKKILEQFEGAFMNGKELRIPYTEAGQRVEIKVALTCAKENIGSEGGIVQAEVAKTATDTSITELTPEEKEKVVNFLERVNAF